mgnify:CR=1 FL=1
MNDYHQPVLLEEVLSLLALGVGSGWIVDCTLGGGGHSAALLERTPPGVRLLGLDRDPDAIGEATERLQGFGDRVVIRQSAFSQVASVIDEMDACPVMGMLFDLGVSSAQLDRASRGFSFRHEGPLDMDMEGRGGYAALRLMEGMEWREFAAVLGSYGEVPRAGHVARVILEAVDKGEIATTKDLAGLVEKRFPWLRKGSRHPATRIFQALRMAVNDEIGELEAALEQIPRSLANGGVAAVISYHSGEDRLVKHGFRKFVKEGGFELPFRKPMRASEGEVESNSRSRTARLRAIRRSDSEVSYE